MGKVIGNMSMGHNSTVSNFITNEEIRIYLGEALQDLRKVMDLIFPDGWDTINIKVKKNE